MIETRISHLIRRNTRGRQFVGAISTDLSDQARRRVGNIGGVISAATEAGTGDTLVAAIEDALVRGLGDALRREPAETPAEMLFETAVMRTNEAMRRLIDDRGLPVDPTTVQGALLARKGRDVVAAAWGTPCLILYHPIGKETQVFDLLEDNTRKPEAGFVHLVAGCLSPEDRLLVATTDLRPILGHQQLADIITTQDPESAIAAIRQALGEIGDASSFAMFVADIREQSDAQPLTHSATQSSIDSLMDTESRTKDIMNGSLLSGLWRKFRRHRGQKSAVVPEAVETASVAVESTTPEEVEFIEEAAVDSQAAQDSVEQIEEVEIVVPARTNSAARREVPAWLLERTDATEKMSPSEDTEDLIEPNIAEAESIPVEQEESLKTKEGAEETTSVLYRRASHNYRMIIPPTAEHPPLEIEVYNEIEDEIGPTTTAACETPTLWEKMRAVVLRRERGGIEAVSRGYRGGIEDQEIAAVTDESKELVSADLVDETEPTAAVTPPILKLKLVDKLMTRFDGWLSNLPRRSLILLTAALTLLAALNISLATANFSRLERQAAAEFDQAVAQVQQKLDAAEASIIYRDDNHTGILMNEAEALLNALPNREPRQQLAIQQLKQIMEDKRRAMRRVVDLAAGEVTATIVSDKGEPRLTRAVMAGAHLIVAAESGEIFRVAVSGGATDKIATLSAAPIIVTSDEGNAVVGTATGELQMITSSGRVYAKKAALDADTGIDDAAYYGGRLYLLDAKHNRVLRLPTTTDGFGKPAVYLKDATDVSRGVGLAIDGNAWVLLKDGKVFKLMRGVQEPFSVGAINPQPGTPERFKLSTSGELLCYMDVTPRRVACFNKNTGLLQAQYEGGTLNDVTDFIFDDKNKSLLVLSGNRVLRFIIE